MTSTRLPGMEDMPEKEYEIAKAQELAKYRAKMNALCPMPELRFAAKEITMSDNKCDLCEYRGINCNDGCRLPHDTAYTDALEIDVCYEGILKYLSEQMDKRQVDTGMTIDDVDTMLECSGSTIYINLKTVAALCDVINHITGNKKNISLALMGNMFTLLEGVQEMIEGWKDDNEDDDYDDY